MRSREYDPLTYENLMAGLVYNFERRPKVPLGGIRKVYGSGIYALYYSGGDSEYGKLGGRPIYTGKAARRARAREPALQGRMRQGRCREGCQNTASP